MQNEQATMVGESIVITGNLSGDEDLIILGRVEGTISLSCTLFVSTDGVVKADVAVENAVISGVVVGNVVATGCIEITETGRVVGDLRAPRVIVTTGARVRGQVAAGDLPAAQEASPAAQALRGNMKPMYARMGLPARRPLAQPPVSPRNAAPAVAQAVSGNSAAANKAQAVASDVEGDNSAAQAARRQASNVIAKKKPVQAPRRRD